MTYVPWPTQPFVRHLERQGNQLRQRLQLAPLDVLEPGELIDTFDNMEVVDLLQHADVHGEELRLLKAASPKWSALAYREDDGPWAIAWNPWHAETRIRVSVMEEVSHIMLGHKPTKLVPCPASGLPKREYTKSKEKEAYGVAGAALVPYSGLVELLSEGRAQREIAEHFGVSPQLVRMRANVTRARKVARSA